MPVESFAGGEVFFVAMNGCRLYHIDEQISMFIVYYCLRSEVVMASFMKVQVM